MLQQPVHVDTIGLYVVNTLSITGLLREFRDLPQVPLADGENVYQHKATYFNIIRLTSYLRKY
jgi:hypothetical protein